MKITLFITLLILLFSMSCRPRYVYVEDRSYERHERHDRHQHQDEGYDRSYEYQDNDVYYEDDYGNNEVCVQDAPPRVIVERHRPRRPGRKYVWVNGHWRWNGHRYHWKRGHWRKVRRGYRHWAPGRWVHKRRGWIWIRGRWK